MARLEYEHWKALFVQFLSICSIYFLSFEGDASHGTIIIVNNVHVTHDYAQTLSS